MEGSDSEDSLLDFDPDVVVKRKRTQAKRLVDENHVQDKPEDEFGELRKLAAKSDMECKKLKDIGFSSHEEAEAELLKPVEVDYDLITGTPQFASTRVDQGLDNEDDGDTAVSIENAYFGARAILCRQSQLWPRLASLHYADSGTEASNPRGVSEDSCRLASVCAKVDPARVSPKFLNDMTSAGGKAGGALTRSLWEFLFRLSAYHPSPVVATAASQGLVQLVQTQAVRARAAPSTSSRHAPRSQLTSRSATSATWDSEHPLRFEDICGFFACLGLDITSTTPNLTPTGELNPQGAQGALWQDMPSHAEPRYSLANLRAVLAVLDACLAAEAHCLSLEEVQDVFVACLLVGVDAYALTSPDVLGMARAVSLHLLRMIPRSHGGEDQSPGPDLQAFALRVVRLCQSFQELDASLLILRGIPANSKRCRYVTAVALAQLQREWVLPFVSVADEKEDVDDLEGAEAGAEDLSSLPGTFPEARREVARLTDKALAMVKVETNLRLVIKKTSATKVFDMLSMFDFCASISASGSDLVVPELRAPMREFLETINHCVTISLDPAVQRLKHLASILDSKYLHAKQPEAVQMRLIGFTSPAIPPASRAESAPSLQ